MEEDAYDLPEAELIPRTSSIEVTPEVSQVPPSLPGMARAIFCISYVLFRLSECAPGMAIEVYTGHGWLSSSLADGAARAMSQVHCEPDAPMLITFEGQRKNIEQLMSRDLHMRAAWVQTHPIESLAIRVERTLEAEKMTLVALEGSAYPSELCPKGCKRDENGIFSNILDCFRCPQPQRNQSALREICDRFLVNRTLDLAIIGLGYH